MRQYLTICLVCSLYLLFGPGLFPALAAENGNLTENESQNLTTIQVDNCSSNCTEPKLAEVAQVTGIGNSNITSANDTNVTVAVVEPSQDQAGNSSNLTENESQKAAIIQMDNCSPNSIEEIPAGAATSGADLDEANATSANTSNETAAVMAQGLSIRGTKFSDLNGNGVKDAGEPGIAGWMIHLTRNGGETLDTATDADGNYSFVGLEPSVYIVIEDLAPEGNRTASADQAYSVDLTDKDADHLDFSGLSREPSEISPDISSSSSSDLNSSNDTAANGTEPNSTSPVSPGLSISGTLFNDLNTSGVRDGSEPGLIGWIVHLAQNGTGMADTTTDTAGDYRFTGLQTGRYIITEDHELGWNQTAPGGGAYDVSLIDKDLVGIDFGNFRPCPAPSKNISSNVTALSKAAMNKSMEAGA